MAADVIREAIIRLGVELSKDGLDGASLGQQTAAFKQYNEEVVKATQQHNNLNTAAVETQKQFKEAERAQKAYSEASVQAQEANIRAADAAKQAGDGAFTAARGFALLAASNEESAAEMLKAIAVAQGAFDIFKGGVDVVRGLYEANKALTAASAAATAAEAAKAGAITATGAAATAATPKLVAMNLAMGPIGIGLAAVSAAALAGVALWRQYGDEGEDAIIRINRQLEDQKKKQELVNQATRDANAERDRFRDVLGDDEKIADIQQELNRLRFDDPDDLTAEFRRNRDKFLRSFSRFAPSQRPAGAAERIDAQRDSVIDQLENEQAEVDRRRDLTEDVASLQIRKRQDRLREVNRQLERFEDDPGAALRGDSAQLEAEKQQILGDIKELKSGLVDSFKAFRDEMADLRATVRELQQFRDLAVP